MNKKDPVYIMNITLLSIAGVFILLMFLAIIISNCSSNRNTSTPVEEDSIVTVKIDSATKANDKLILEIKNIDSIKDAKIIEVKKLDNDSTVKLFYQLIRE